MKKNNLDEQRMFTGFLLPLNFLLRLSKKAYDKYLINKIYLHALNIRKANEMIYQHVIDHVQLAPPDLYDECIELLNHYDCWFLQFREEEQKRALSLRTEFIFLQADAQVAFPRKAETTIFEAYNKARKKKTT